jgi:hypothetical protein
VANDAFVQPAQICAIIWKGATTAGDQVVLKHREDRQVLWEAITDTTNTYLGASLPQAGMTAPKGFYVERIDSGRLLVYLAEK